MLKQLDHIFDVANNCEGAHEDIIKALKLTRKRQLTGNSQLILLANEDLSDTKTEETSETGLASQLTEKNPHSEIAQETCKIPDFPETDKKEDTGTDISYLSQLEDFRYFFKAQLAIASTESSGKLANSI